jgi:glyceraldehyde 3-phosphate dehydrogenase
VLPHLNGKLNGTALRVPTDTGSVVEAIFNIEGEVSKEDVVKALEENAQKINDTTLMKKTVYFGDYYQVSQDVVGEPWSSMIIKNVLVVPQNGTTLVKATSFYDNEMGFSNRMAELALIFSGA